MTIRILLADDENLIRTALAQLLSLEDDLDVVAQADNGADAVRLAVREAVDVAVLDLQMPELDGITVAQRLGTQLPGCGTVIVTSHGRPGHLKRALSSGVRGFLPKTTSAATLAQVVRSVHGGGRFVDPELAVKASLSPGTVRNYLSNAMAKLGAANRHDACAIARRLGWI